MRSFSGVAVQYIIAANFYVSLALVILGGALSLSENYGIFEFNVAVYGELANNLRAIMAYLAFTESLIFLLCCITKRYQYYLFAGFFLLITIGSLEAYKAINNIEIDVNLQLCLLYAGVSHILFGAMAIYTSERNVAQ